MDSKQLATLNQQKNKYITLSDVYNLVKQQILIGKMSIESLKFQAEYCNLVKGIQDYTISITNKKIDLINKLNALREEQLKEFDEIRQEECNLFVQDINDLDEHTMEYYNLCKQIEEKQREQNKLIEKINVLQNSLPDEKILDFYKVKPKLDYNPIGNCATES
jgi:hypothetical protein